MSCEKSGRPNVNALQVKTNIMSRITNLRRLSQTEMRQHAQRIRGEAEETLRSEVQQWMPPLCRVQNLPKGKSTREKLLEASENFIEWLENLLARIRSREEIRVRHLTHPSEAPDAESHFQILTFQISSDIAAQLESQLRTLSPFIGWGEEHRKVFAAKIEEYVPTGLDARVLEHLGEHIWCDEMAIAFLEPVKRLRQQLLDLDNSCPTTSKPKWDKDRGELSIDGEIIRNVKASAKNLRYVLDAFEARKWPARIDDPIKPNFKDQGDPQRLHETLRTLNERLKKIHFETDGTGRGVRWKRKSE